MEQGASDGLLYKQLGGRPKKNRRDERKNASRRRQLGLSEESTQRTRTHTHKQNYCLRRGAQVLLTATARKESCKACIAAQRGLE